MKPRWPLGILIVTSPLVPAGIGFLPVLIRAGPTGENGWSGSEPVVTRRALAVPPFGRERLKATVAAFTSPGWRR